MAVGGRRSGGRRVQRGGAGRGEQIRKGVTVGREGLGEGGGGSGGSSQPGERWCVGTVLERGGGEKHLVSASVVKVFSSFGCPFDLDVPPINFVDNTDASSG